MTALATLPSGRSTLPVVRQVDVLLPEAEHARLSELAARIAADEPALSCFEVFGRDVVVGLDGAPALLFEDHSEINLSTSLREEAFRYRSRLLAGDGDLVLIGGRRHAAFEQYCRDVVGLGDPVIVTVPPRSRGSLSSLAARCAASERAFNMILEIARDAGRINLIPYLGTGSVWKLAGQIGAATGARVRVAASPPRLAQRVNDKLWFDQRVVEVIGKDARPPNFHAFGPAAVAGRIAQIARRSERVVVKVPDSAGSAGNIVLDSASVRRLPLSRIRNQILKLLRARGWSLQFPLLVGVWDCEVLSSPSVQVWVPLAEQGLPVIEGLFEQLVCGAEGQFIGATAIQLAEPLRQRLATEAMQLACLFQKLGYFGRCSFDAIITGRDWRSADVRWIECNGRWGGTSIPMTLANRLTGDWTQREMMIIQRLELKMNRYEFPAALELLEAVLYRHDGDGTGVIITNPEQLEQGSGLHMLLLGRDRSHAQQQLAQVEEIFFEIQQTSAATSQVLQ